MDHLSENPPSHTGVLGWFPEFLELGRRRMHAQVRLLGLAVLVGIVAGLGAMLFQIATQSVEQFALGPAQQ